MFPFNIFLSLSHTGENQFPLQADALLRSPDSLLHEASPTNLVRVVSNRGGGCRSSGRHNRKCIIGTNLLFLLKTWINAMILILPTFYSIPSARAKELENSFISQTNISLCFKGAKYIFFFSAN